MEAALQSCISQQQQKPNPSMWNWTGSSKPNSTTDDDSWEVRAFAEDTSSLMGTTWPPRSYACTFCRREFKSAQALGGHMNVHRRDRARLRQSPCSASAHPTVLPLLPQPPPEFVANGGILLIYPLGANPAGAAFGPAMASPSAFVSRLPACNDGISKEEGNDDGVVVEELDLELRLGR